MARIVSMLALSALLLGSAVAAEEGDARQITVTGHGQIAAAPDMATVTVGVTHAEREARAAMSVVSASVARILERLTAEGIDPRDVQTRRLTLNPLWSNRSSVSKDNPEITGFSASNMVMVRVRDLNRVGDILDALLGDGANEFHGLSFGLQDPDPLADDARRAAVADGIARARLLAEAAGVTLGPVQSISDHGGEPRPQMMEMASARGGAMPVAGGEVTVQATVTMVFVIGE